MRRGLGVVMLAACRFAPEAPDAGGHGGSDAMGSAGPPPAFYAVGSAHGSGMTAQCGCPIQVPMDTDNAVLGYVGIGSRQNDPGVPTIESVTLNGIVMKEQITVTGTPGAPNFGVVTRSAQYILTGVGAGNAVMMVSLSAAADSLHCDAMSFTGVNPDMPVRASAVGSGRDMSSSVTVASAAGDLVVNDVGQGNGISNAVGNVDPEFIDNVSSDTTLDNTAGGTIAGAAPSITVSWDFEQTDEWQSISSSLEPVQVP